MFSCVNGQGSQFLVSPTVLLCQFVKNFVTDTEGLDHYCALIRQMRLPAAVGQDKLVKQMTCLLVLATEMPEEFEVNELYLFYKNE